MKNLKVSHRPFPLFLLVSIISANTLFASDAAGIKDALVTASSWSTPKKVFVGGGLLVAGYAGSGLVKKQSEQAYNALATACLIPAAPAAWDILTMDYLGLGSREELLRLTVLTNKQSSTNESIEAEKRLKTTVQKEHIRNAAVNFMLVGAAGFVLRTALGISKETFWGAAKKTVTGLGVVYCGGKALGFSVQVADPVEETK